MYVCRYDHSIPLPFGRLLDCTACGQQTIQRSSVIFSTLNVERHGVMLPRLQQVGVGACPSPPARVVHLR